MPWSIFQQGGGEGVAVTWAQQLLQKLGVPVSQQNVQFVYDWEESEGGGGKYNPLNQGPVPNDPSLTTTGQQYGGGAADFASWQAGLQGAYDYLHFSNYSGVLQGLQRSSYSEAAQALWASPWAGSHYGYGSRWRTDAPPGAAPIPATDLAVTQTGTPGSGGGLPGQLSGDGWWVDKGTGQYRKASTSPGQSWVFIPGTTPSMTVQQAMQTLAHDVSVGTYGYRLVNPVSSVTDALSAIANAIQGIVSLLNSVLAAVEWLFVPSHWVRIFCFLGGVLLAIPGTHALMHTGESDVSLALGILMISLSGVLFFIAFHNLPDSVNSLQSLLGHVSTGISGQAQQPANAGG